jgi:hypothetical protein
MPPGFRNLHLYLHLYLDLDLYLYLYLHLYLPPAAGVGQGHDELVEKDGKMVYMQVGGLQGRVVGPPLLYFVCSIIAVSHTALN